MRLSYKLFLSIFLVSLLLLSGMVLLTKSAINSSFLTYINDVQHAILKSLQPDLEAFYKERGGWGYMSPRQWHKLLKRHRPERILQGSFTQKSSPQKYPKSNEQVFSHEAPPHLNRKPRHPPKRKGMPPGIRLLDDKKNIILGPPKTKLNAFELPLMADDNIIGYLSLDPVGDIHNELDVRFTEQLIETIQIIALVGLFISGILGLLLAKSLVRPIKKLTAGAKKLTAGDFSARLDIKNKSEFGKLAKDFNVLASTLENNEKSRKQWIADISHELRTPLTILRGEIEALQDGIRVWEPGTTKSLLNESLRLEKIVNDLYELSLSDVGALSYKKETIDIQKVIHASVNEMVHEFKVQKIAVSIKGEPKNKLMVFADAMRLQQLFSNLLTNSLRYTDTGGRLIIDIRDAGEKIKITFDDSSPGVPENEIPKLFERLYRVESSRNRSSGGAGLGLSICQNIVAAHQGEIKVRESYLGGLCIQLIFNKEKPQ